MQTRMNDNRHAAFIHASNCITLHSDLVHMVEILKIAYGTSWKSRSRSCIRKVRMSGYIYQELVDGSICRKLPVESAGTGCAYIIHRSDHMYSGGSETERPRSFWMQMIIHRNNLLAVKNDRMHFAYNF